MRLQREDISSVQIHLNRNRPEDCQHYAYASCVVMDSLKILDMKIILMRGDFSLVFPTIPKRRQCWHCSKPTTVIAKYCNKCGAEQEPTTLERKDQYINSTYPINRETRAIFEEIILGAFHEAYANYLQEVSDGDAGPVGEGSGTVPSGEGGVEGRNPEPQRIVSDREVAGSVFVSSPTHAFGIGL